MTEAIVEPITKTSADILTKGGQTAEKILKGNAEALTESGTASARALQEVTKAYQDLAAKNYGRLTDSIKALSAVKTPTEFMQLQQKLLQDAFQAGLADSQHIADLTVAVFNGAFAPMQQQVTTALKTAKN